MARLVIEPQMQYATLSQQGDTAQTGMWAFLATETLFFGALIFTYFIYRMSYPHEFAVAAKDAVLWCGSVNLGIIMSSSLTMVLAVNAAAEGRRNATMFWLSVTAFLGLCFLGVKGWEYRLDYVHHDVPVLNYQQKPGAAPGGELFWVFYFIGTGLHAVHLTTGVGIVLYMLLWRVRRGAITPAYYAPLEVVGLYWSFVDTVWLFLFPCIYLVGRS